MPRPRIALPCPRPRLADSVLARVAALAAVGAIGAAGLAVTESGVVPAAAGLAAPSASGRDPVGVSTAHRPMPRAAHRAGSRRAAAAPARHRTAPAKHRTAKHRTAKAGRRASGHARWLPTGMGMWLYEWRHSNHGDAASIVRRARSVGLTTLYLRTGSSWDGFAGGGHLRRLLHATRGTDVRVVAWDFPRLDRQPFRQLWRYNCRPSCQEAG